MIATGFDESERVLAPPADMTSEECEPLPVYNDDGSCLSCWDMSWRERISALLFGRVWLWVRGGGRTQPPVAIQVVRSPFFRVTSDARR